MTTTKPFLSTCYGDPSATEVPPCCEAATNKLTFSTTSVLLLLDVPLPLSRGTIFRRQKNPRRGYRPKIAGILFVCNEPGRSIPYCAQTLGHRRRDERKIASLEMRLWRIMERLGWMERRTDDSTLQEIDMQHKLLAHVCSRRRQ